MKPTLTHGSNGLDSNQVKEASMALRSGARRDVVEDLPATDQKVYTDGLVAGLVAAVTLAIWFLIVDSLGGRPLYTPTVLGTALLRRGEGLATPELLPTSFEMILGFTWVHLLVFLLIGMGASRLLVMAERNPNVGFGVVLLFVFFESAYLCAAMLFAQPLLHALAWPTVVLGNLLAAAAMAGVLWHRHPALSIWP
jgi:hypothetical protein